MVLRCAKSKPLLVRAWPSPPLPPPEASLGRVLQKKEDLLGKAHCLVVPCGDTAALRRGIAVQVRALGLVLRRGGKGWQTAPGTQLGWLLSRNGCKSVGK